MNQDKEYLDTAARSVYRQMEDDPLLGIPVDPDVAAWMGAMEDDAMSFEDALESAGAGEESEEAD